MSEQLLRLNVVDDDPHTVAVYGFNCVIVQYVFRCVQDMEGDQEEGGDSGVGGGVDASWLEADGRIGMVGQAQQREEGVFFHTGSGVRQRRQEGAGLCTPLHSSRVIYLIVFSPRPAVQLGQPEHKRPGVHSSPRTWPPVRRSPTFDKLLHNTWVADRFLSRIPACTVRLRRVLNLLLVSQATQESSWHRETHPSHQTQSPSFYGDMHK